VREPEAEGEYEEKLSEGIDDMVAGTGCRKESTGKFMERAGRG
jgi:hypothetical protein